MLEPLINRPYSEIYVWPRPLPCVAQASTDEDGRLRTVYPFFYHRRSTSWFGRWTINISTRWMMLNEWTGRRMKQTDGEDYNQ